MMASLSVVLLLCCSLLGISQSKVYNVAVSQVEPAYTEFGDVLAMIPHPSDISSLIVIGRDSVWTFNPGTKSKVRVAMMAHMRAVVAVNIQEILVTVHYRHCLFRVNLNTGLINFYVGHAFASGYRDGTGLTALFNSPAGMVHLDGKVFVCDSANGRIRVVDQQYVSTLISNLRAPVGLTWNGVELIFTFSHGVGRANTKTGAHELLSKSYNQGLKNGPIESAMFRFPSTALALTEDIILTNDGYNYDVRLIDLAQKTASTVAIFKGFKSKSLMFSLALLNGQVYFGVNTGAMFRFAAREIVELVNAECPDDMNLTTPAGKTILTINPPHLKLHDRLECIECPTTRTSFPVGEHNITYRFKDKVTADILSCTHVIIVEEGPDPETTTSTAKIHATAERQSTTRLQIDKTTVAPTLSTSSTVETTRGALISTTGVAKNSTPGSLNMITTVSMRTTTDAIQQLSNRTTATISRMTEKTSAAAVTEQVTRLIGRSCKNVTKIIHLASNETQTVQKVKIGEMEIQMKFAVGDHEITLGENCFQIFKVIKSSVISRQVQLQVEYQVDCANLNMISYAVVDGHMLLHTKYLKMYCPQCMIPDSLTKPQIACNLDKMIVVWNTHFVTHSPVLTAGERKELQTGILNFQSKYYAGLDITIVRSFPFMHMIVSPNTDKSGLFVKAVILSKCKDVTITYDKTTDSCGKP